MITVLISACLLGFSARYDGKSKKYPGIPETLIKNGINYIPFCPEYSGGLPIPRNPSEIILDKVISSSGDDVTENYVSGAENALKLCRKYNIRYAILKENSPSCGYGKIYDGTFSGKLTSGNGITTRLLIENGIKVYGETETEKLISEIQAKRE